MTKVKSFQVTPYFFLVLIVAIHLLILSKIIFFPYPELFVYPYLVAKGLLPYKEIFDQHFPGLMFFPINLYTLGVKTPESLFLMNLVVVALNHFLIFKVGENYLKSSLKALFANFIYFFWHPYFEGYVFWIDSLIPIFLLPAYYFFIKDKSLRNPGHGFLVGLILGLASVFKQTTIPLLILLSLFLLIKGKYKYLCFLIFGFLLPLSAVFIYFFKIGVIRNFFYWTVTFNLTTFAKMGRKYPTLIDLIKAFWIFSPLLLLNYVNLFKRRINDKFFLLLIFFIGTLAFVYARFDLVHLQPAIPFFTISVAGLLEVIPKKMSPFLISSYILVSFFFLTPFYKWAFQRKIFFFGEYEKKLAEKVTIYAGKDETIFALGTTPHLYFLTDRLPPGKVFVFQFPWFIKETEDEILKGIIIDPPKVVVRDRNAEVQGMNLVDFMPKINSHIEKYYTVIDMVDKTEIMVPK